MTNFAVQSMQGERNNLQNSPHFSDEKADAMVSNEIFCVRSPKRPWGDYGRILFDGMGSLNTRNDQFELKRTGPFVPPITFPNMGVVLVTDSTKKNLDKFGLTGVTFSPVVKQKIVHVPWERWDQKAKEPAEYPLSNEPGGYILENPHSAKVSSSMGVLWQAVIKNSAQIIRSSTRKRVQFEYSSGSWNGFDLFSVEDNYSIFCSVRLKDFLAEHYCNWCAFENVDEVEG